MLQPKIRTHFAFSLVELLMVIAVVALVMAILLPTLARAREAALGVGCDSHLSQVGRLMQTWTADHQDRVAPANVSNHVSFQLTSGQWPLLLEGYRSPMATRTTQTIRDDRASNMYYCPAWVPLDNATLGNLGQSGYIGSWFPTSYLANGTAHVGYDPDQVVGGVREMVRLSSIMKPSQTFSLMDSAVDSAVSSVHKLDDFISTYSYGAGGVSRPPVEAMHVGRSVNALFLDGHSASGSHDDLVTAAQLGTATWMGWKTSDGSLIP